MSYSCKEPSTAEYDLRAMEIAETTRCRTAVIALVCSFVGFLDFGLFAVAGLYLAYGAKREIAGSDGKLTGEKMVKWAIVVGWIALASRLIIGFFLVTQGYSMGRNSL